MKKRVIVWLPLIAVLILASLVLQVSAENQVSVYRSETGDRYLQAYVKDPGEVQSVEVRIGSELCTEVTSEIIGGPGTPVHTYILLDNSLSIPDEYREFIKQVMKDIVGRRQANEYISVATFDREIHYCASGSQDNNLLNQTVDGITFQDLDTRIPDVLYNFYQELQEKKLSGMARIILISDGMESTGIGYTKEEVLEQMTQAGYPVYAIGCQREDNQSGLENMFRFSRATNAQYFLLDGQQDAGQMDKALNEIFQGLAVTAHIPAKMGDGSSKSVTITYHTPNGTSVSSFTQTMPIIDVPQTEAAKTGEPETPEVSEPGSVSGTSDNSGKSVSETGSPGTPGSSGSETGSSGTLDSSGNPGATEASVSQGTPKSGSASDKGIGPASSKKKESPAVTALEFLEEYKLAVIICTALVAAALAALFVFLCRKRRKTLSAGEASAEGDEYRTEILTDKTELMEDEDKTVFVEEFVTVRFRDLNNPARIFEAPLENSMTIGRSTAKSQIIIDYDRSVSGVHCELYRMSGKIYIRDLDSANGTEVDNLKISSDTEITPGCVIKLGRLQFEVDIF